jgi:ABC-type Fe3+ transport system substrate-binding protein
MSNYTKNLRLAAATGILTLAMGGTTIASETSKAPGDTATSAVVHMPSAIRGSVVEQIAEKFAKTTGHTIHSEYQRSGGFSKIITGATAAGSLDFGVLITYGRTGETPPGRDIFKHLNNARDILQPLPDQLEMAPQFAGLADTGAGQLMVPYVEMMVISYNPKLIDTADVPKSWAALAEFEGSLAIPGRGCFAMRTLASLYDVVGKEKFEKIIQNAKMPAMETMKDDPRKGDARPFGSGVVSAQLLNGTHQVSIGSVVGAEVQEAIANGTLAVIWPSEGAIAFPYLMAVKKDPAKADMALLDFIAKDEAIQQMFVDYGISSTLVGGKVTALLKDNDFNFRIVPKANKINPEVHQEIIDIVARNAP